MQSLTAYLTRQLPEGMTYSDATQLCLRLYSSLDGVPEALRPQLTRTGLADSFAELARIGWVQKENVPTSSIFGAQFHALTDKGHWIEVIASIFKKGSDIVDCERGEELARKVGFV